MEDKEHKQEDMCRRRKKSVFGLQQRMGVHQSDRAQQQIVRVRGAHDEQYRKRAIEKQESHRAVGAALSESGQSTAYVPTAQSLKEDHFGQEELVHGAPPDRDQCRRKGGQEEGAPQYVAQHVARQDRRERSEHLGRRRSRIENEVPIQEDQWQGEKRLLRENQKHHAEVRLRPKVAPVRVRGDEQGDIEPYEENKGGRRVAHEAEKMRAHDEQRKVKDLIQATPSQSVLYIADVHRAAPSCVGPRGFPAKKCLALPCPCTGISAGDQSMARTKSKTRSSSSPARIRNSVAAMRRNFGLGTTRPYEFRVAQLHALRALIKENEPRLLLALRQDLGKPEFEAYAAEIGFVLEEIHFSLKRLRGWMRPESKPTPLFLMPSRSLLYSEPRGVALIISPWNYPIQLLLSPLVGSIAAGNCSILKPSELAPTVSTVVTELIARYFSPDYITCVPGAVRETQALLSERFDYIFFTGSTQVGRIVSQAAAKHLTPCTLELGGKSPCIIDRKVNLEVALRRVVWGKFFNAGQTCVAPDYLLVPAEKQAAVLSGLGKQVRQFYGSDPSLNPDYARIVSARHFDRLVSFIKKGKVSLGGEHDRKSLYIAPTILEDVDLKQSVMQEEIFGPILPVLPYRTLDDAFATVRGMPDPLSFYFFSSDRGNQNRAIDELQFGGGCINNTLQHLGNPHLPFGGRGDSGYGSYHGRFSFEIFSHRKAVMKSGFFPDIRLRYTPYKGKLGLLKRFLG